MSRQLTLGSLFDGSGGFPLGAVLHGIEPVWASEIEPFPIRVTMKRLPGMKHNGDISAINGAEVEPADIIPFGSPCTDMSVAGKRAGLGGNQSVLFYQAIRIIKEMRCATDGKYPRFIVWENVPGAFSSNKGADFKAVLDAIVQIAEPGAEVPAPGEGGWPYADVLMGDGWSVAYRTLDAQYYGVAQRRKRIYLVADFGSERAGEILFERESVYWDFAPRFPEGEGAAGGAADRPGTAVGMNPDPRWQPVLAFEPGAASRLGGHCWEEFAGTLRADAGDNQTAVVVEHHPMDSRVKVRNDGVVQTLSSRMGTGGNNVPLAMSAKAYGICSRDSNAMLSPNPRAGIYEADTARTLDRSGGNPACNQGGIAVCVQGSMIGREEKNGPQGSGVHEGTSFTLNTADRHAVAYAMTTGGFAEVHLEIAATLMARDYKDPQAAFAPLTTLAQEMESRPRYIVRRLTPSECGRLQGFPDGWCDGLETPEPTDDELLWWAEVFETHRKIMGTSTKPASLKQVAKWLKNPYSDSAAYKMWGNGVALPCVSFVMAGIVLLTQNECQ